MNDRFNRRQFLKKMAIAGVGGTVIGGGLFYWRNRLGKVLPPEAHARVTILKAASYRANLVDLIRRGLSNYPAFLERVRGSRIVLKPNLVEYYEARRVNTHPAVVAAAIAVFRSFGAREIVVAEGPGHQRDTELLVEESGLWEALKSEQTPFVDLNHDSIRPVRLSANYTQLNRLFFPVTILGADLIVSMPKLKTHHWAGVTLSLKNMFGTVPGVKYGWPKNLLHWRGIDRSIVDINLALRPAFAIIDGIEGMEGDGPLRGETVQSGVLIMGDNPTAVDATGTRVMGLNPERILYLQVMRAHGGVLGETHIEQAGERVATVRHDFQVLPNFSCLKLGSPERKLLQ